MTERESRSRRSGESSGSFPEAPASEQVESETAARNAALEGSVIGAAGLGMTTNWLRASGLLGSPSPVSSAAEHLQSLAALAQ